MYVLSKFPRKIKGWGVLLNGIWKVRGKWSSIFNRWRESSGPQLGEGGFGDACKLIANFNIVILLDIWVCCIKGEEKILIYKYSPNRSLDSFPTIWTHHIPTNIIRRNSTTPLKRLLYLHKYSRLRVIHRDLKVSNILLDNEMNPKTSYEQNKRQQELLFELGTITKPLSNYVKFGRRREKTNELQLFSLKSLAIATNDFSMENKLGEGGLGPVYKGKLLDEQEVEIKRLSRSSGQGLEETKRVVGTYSFIFHCSGYMSPEYVMHGIFSTKSDVFRFGVLLLEILSGRKSHSNYHYEHPVNLAGYAWELWVEGKALELVDQALDGSYPNSIVIRCIHIALLCVQENPMDRPTMTDIVIRCIHIALLCLFY
ncbi:hypothetical protein VitviT2T_013446 [Vitis vinifera]|uniref:Protein kinase domain-containing protein n=1 Tax=Vitis vinifera TaxID=29760 RepID=A0ABY9CHM9_VITVI|nr:hypothetical protein VitviT2T_013446 [Vitis vinifera]